MSLLLKLIQAKLDSSGFDWIQLHSLQLIPSQKTLTAEIKLAGEEQFLRVDAVYRVTPDDQIHIESLTTSRRWLTEVAELALAKTGRSFPLPEGVKGKLIRFFL